MELCRITKQLGREGINLSRSYVGIDEAITAYYLE